MTTQRFAKAGWSELLLWLVGRRRRYHVTNRSMLPRLHPGDTVFVDVRAYRDQPPRVGDTVVAHNPNGRGPLLIKRVESVSAAGYFLTSENRDEGTDSRTFGAVSQEHIVGRVTSRA